MAEKKRNVISVKKTAVSKYDDNTVITKVEERLSDKPEDVAKSSKVVRDNNTKVKMSDMNLLEREKTTQRTYDDGLIVAETQVLSYKDDYQNPKVISDTTTTYN